MTLEEHKSKVEETARIIEELKHYDELPDDTPATVGMIRDMRKLSHARKANRYNESMVKIITERESDSYLD